MANYIRPVGTSHHNSDHGCCKPPIFEVQEGMDVEYEALLAIWRAGGVDGASSLYLPPTPEQFAEARRSGGVAIPMVEVDQSTGQPLQEQDPDGDGQFALWYEQPEKEGDEPNIGYGDGTSEGTDKYSNTWVHAYPWEPPADRQRELEALSKQELVLLLLKAEAQV